MKLFVAKSKNYGKIYNEIIYVTLMFRILDYILFSCENVKYIASIYEVRKGHVSQND